jgi:hypothetical protein
MSSQGSHPARFHDVTNDPQARGRVDQLPESRVRLEKLGFRPLGYLGDELIPGQTPWVHEVLTSPEGDAFATLALSPPHPLQTRPRTIPTVVLHTVLEDGSIIITTTFPKYLRFLDHPKAGSYLDGSTDVSPEEIWQWHKERVAEIAGVRECSPLRHDSMRLRIWIGERCYLVSSFVTRMVVVSVEVVTVAFIIAFSQIMDAFHLQLVRWFGAAFWRTFYWLIGVLLIVAAGWFVLWSRVQAAWRVGQWLARLRAWPRRRPYEPTQ